MTTSQLSLIAPTVDKVGQAAILMGKDTTTAQEIMTAAFRGLNGEFDILRSNFGITKQTLMDAGWSGAADDVEGYNAALSKVLDENLDLSGVMDSTTGKIEKIKKAFRTAGKIIGEQVVPYIEKAADIFLRLTQQFPGLTTGIIAIAAGFMLFLTVLPILGSVFGALKSMAVFLGIVKGAEDALTLSKMKSIAVDAATTAYTYAKAAALAVLGAATRVYNFIVAEGTIATKLATAAQWLWNAALAANPIGIVVVAIIALIAVLAYLYNSNETVRNAINWLWAGLQQLGGYIYGGLLAAWNALVGALSWVWDILVQVGSFIMGTFMSAWNAITSAMSPIISALGKLWGALQKVFGGWLNQKGAEANVILGAIAYVAGVVWGAFAKLAEIIGGYLKPHIDNLIIIFTILWDLLGGAFTAVWQTLSASIAGVIDFISNFIIILSDLVAGNITATEFMGLVWDEFAKLLTTLFLAMVNGVGKFTADLIRKAFEAGKGILDGFIQWLSQLPGRAWTLFMQFLGYLSQLPGMAYNRAARVGSSIVQAIRGYLTSLPGQMYNWGKQAIGRFTNAIIDSIPGLRGALDMVSSLFPKSPPKEGPLSEVTEDGMRSWMNSILDAGREVISEFSLDGMGLDLPTTAMSITTPVGVGDVDMPVMPAKDIFNTEEITRESSKVIEAANSTKTGAITAFNQMGDTISSSLKRLVGTDKESWRQIKSNTASQLSSMRTTTANATKNMTNAWNTMASQIVGSAQRIRSGSSGQIASLSLNIKTFYGKLINPTSWFAGPRPSRKGSSASFKAAGPGLTPERILDGFRFLESPCTDCYAGGWNYSAPNTKKINNTVNGYPVIMPDIRGLFVRDFLNTDNPLYGNLKLFEAVAERLIGPTSYDFYYNGRYSNLEALQRGAFNCWDGAEILMALGSAMGLPVSMARGKWGNIGHVAAIVGGKIFDTTQRQKRGVWRGSHGVSFGPAPPHFKPDGGTGDIRVEEDFNLNLTLDFRNVPDSVDEAYLRTILMDVINDSEVVRQLIRNRAFMSTLKGEMEKGRLRSRRTGG
jgi:phage-related protein